MPVPDWLDFIAGLYAANKRIHASLAKPRFAILTGIVYFLASSLIFGVLLGFNMKILIFLEIFLGYKKRLEFFGNDLTFIVFQILLILSAIISLLFFLWGLISFYKRRRYIWTNTYVVIQISAVLNLLKGKLSPPENLKMRLDFSGYKDKNKLKHQTPTKAIKNIKKWSLHYEDTWMDAEAILNDGNHLSWTISSLVSEYWTSISRLEVDNTETPGKPLVKSNVRESSEAEYETKIVVLLTFDKKRYALAGSELRFGEDKIKKEEDTNHILIMVERTTVGAYSPYEFVNVISSAYSCVTFVRQ